MPTEYTGHASFNLAVPYKVIETGQQQKKPLIIYLHGYKQNMHYFEKKCTNLVAFDAYHLFIQGPYPIYDEKHQRSVAEWGRAWYLYDGNQEQFIRSLEDTSVFLQDLIDTVKAKLMVSRTVLLGYSMGGYLAGYVTLSRPGYIDDLIVIGGRIKTEHFRGMSYDDLNVLHLHGINDQSVGAERSRESCEELKLMGASVSFKEIETGHRLTDAYISAVKKWMLSHKFYITLS